MERLDEIREMISYERSLKLSTRQEKSPPNFARVACPLNFEQQRNLRFKPRLPSESKPHPTIARY